MATPGQIIAALAPVVGKAGAAGAAGNLMQESSDRSNAPGGGLAQWQGPRAAAEASYAHAHGLAPGSDAAALGYLKQDLQTNYAGLAAKLRQTNDPGAAAVLFSQQYERPGIPMIQNRINYARAAAKVAPGAVLVPGMAPSKGQRPTVARIPGQPNTIGGGVNTQAAAEAVLQQQASRGIGDKLSTANPLADYEHEIGTGQFNVPTTQTPGVPSSVTTTTRAAAPGAAPGPNVAGGDFKTPAPAKVVQMQNFAKSLVGAPYSKANHAGAFDQATALIKKFGTDCSGLVSVLLGPHGAGILNTPQTTFTIEQQAGIQHGPGQHVTMWNRANGSQAHIIIQIGTDWFESGGRLGGGVTQMNDQQAKQELGGGGFVPLHPRGF